MAACKSASKPFRQPPAQCSAKGELGERGPALDAHLGHGDDVWLDPMVLKAPEVGARPAEAGLHLVGYTHSPRCPHNLYQLHASDTLLAL